MTEGDTVTEEIETTEEVGEAAEEIAIATSEAEVIEMIAEGVTGTTETEEVGLVETRNSLTTPVCSFYHRGCNFGRCGRRGTL